MPGSSSFPSWTEGLHCWQELCDHKIVDSKSWRAHNLANHPDKLGREMTDAEKADFNELSGCWSTWSSDFPLKKGIVTCPPPIHDPYRSSSSAAAARPPKSKRSPSPSRRSSSRSRSPPSNDQRSERERDTDEKFARWERRERKQWEDSQKRYAKQVADTANGPILWPETPSFDEIKEDWPRSSARDDFQEFSAARILQIPYYIFEIWRMADRSFPDKSGVQSWHYDHKKRPSSHASDSERWQWHLDQMMDMYDSFLQANVLREATIPVLSRREFLRVLIIAYQHRHWWATSFVEKSGVPYFEEHVIPFVTRHEEDEEAQATQEERAAERKDFKAFESEMKKAETVYAKKCKAGIAIPLTRKQIQKFIHHEFALNPETDKKIDPHGDLARKLACRAGPLTLQKLVRWREANPKSKKEKNAGFMRKQNQLFESKNWVYS
jgi:hypothetical protein